MQHIVVKVASDGREEAIALTDDLAEATKMVGVLTLAAVQTDPDFLGLSMSGVLRVLKAQGRELYRVKPTVAHE